VGFAACRAICAYAIAVVLSVLVTADCAAAAAAADDDDALNLCLLRAQLRDAKHNFEHVHAVQLLPFRGSAAAAPAAAAAVDG
jgi:hypothetical protein